MYITLTSDGNGLAHRKIWKGKIPAKIKIFMWLLENNAILTKDNLIKRKWVGYPKCSFSDQNESINHLFFECCIVVNTWSVCSEILDI